MKHHTSLILMASIMFSGLLFTSSCKKGDDAKPAPAANTVKASVNTAGQGTFAFTASEDSIGVSLHKDSLAISLTDEKTHTKMVMLGFPARGTGTYGLTGDFDNPHAMAWLFIDGGTALDNLYYGGDDITGDGKTDGAGKLTITSLGTNRIKGTFSMTLYNMKGEKATVNNGSFDCALYRY
jgi:hypothetical protein